MEYIIQFEWLLVSPTPEDIKPHIIMLVRLKWKVWSKVNLICWANRDQRRSVTLPEILTSDLSIRHPEAKTNCNTVKRCLLAIVIGSDRYVISNATHTGPGSWPQ